jgi:hypothetical protein
MFHNAIVSAVGVGLALALALGSRAWAQRRNQRLGPPAAAPIDVPDGYATVIVRRPSVGIAGAARRMVILVDDKVQAKVKSNAATAIAVPPGHHTATVRISRVTAGPWHFDATPGGSTLLEVNHVLGDFSGRWDIREVS